MGDNLKFGFAKHTFAPRYDVSEFREDAWHDHAANRTSEIVGRETERIKSIARVLNAGSGVYSLGLQTVQEVRVDLFEKPLKAASTGVCADIQMLPFASHTFDLVVCVGEVVGYCDPALAIAELARVLAPGGTVICDFASSRAYRHWFKPTFARAADIVISEYNGTPERCWVYDPDYVASLFERNGITLGKKIGTHNWSAIARRMGFSVQRALWLQERFRSVPLPSSWAEVVTFVGEKA